MIDYRQEYKELYRILLKIEPRFNIENYEPRILSSIIAWVWKYDNWNQLNVNYSKGFFLYGSMGRGKSMTLLLLQQYLKNVQARYKDVDLPFDYRLRGDWTSASLIANQYAAEGLPGLDDLIKPGRCLFIDELGREPIPASNFGTKMNVLEFLLQMRYDNRRRSVTHVTTNLSLKKISEIYGAYIADRCLEMFNFIEFKGKSLRRP